MLLLLVVGSTRVSGDGLKAVVGGNYTEGDGGDAGDDAIYKKSNI